MAASGDKRWAGAKDPVLLNQTDFVWHQITSEQAWATLFTRLVESLDKEDLKRFMATSYEGDLATFAESGDE